MPVPCSMPSFSANVIWRINASISTVEAAAATEDKVVDAVVGVGAGTRVGAARSATGAVVGGRDVAVGAAVQVAKMLRAVVVAVAGLSGVATDWAGCADGCRAVQATVSDRRLMIMMGGSRNGLTRLTFARAGEKRRTSRLPPS